MYQTTVVPCINIHHYDQQCDLFDSTGILGVIDDILSHGIDPEVMVRASRRTLITCKHVKYKHSTADNHQRSLICEPLH